MIDAAKRGMDTATSNGTARRIRNKPPGESGTVVMATVVCEQCGAQFAISHRSALQNPMLVSRQASWLADKFVWDHIQENAHRNSIPLPGAREMK